MANELANASLAPAAAPQTASAPVNQPPTSAPEAAPAPLPAPLDAVAAGQIPAVTLKAFDKNDPIHEYVVSNFDNLSKLGLDYTELGGDKHLSVIFNPAKISEADVHAAYKEGRLDQVAPLSSVAEKAVAAPATPAAPAGDLSGATSAPVAPQTPAAPLASVQAPPANSSMQKARSRNLTAITAQPQNKPTGGPLTANSRRAF